MTTSSPLKRSLLKFMPKRRLIAAACALVVLALVALYGMIAPSGNSSSAQIASGSEGNCKDARILSSKLAPLAKGELAAFGVQATPRPMTQIAFKDGNGQQKTLSEFKGRTILLNLWATWCAPCRHEMPALDKLNTLLGGADFEVIAINIDQRNLDKPRQWLIDNKVANLAYYSDPTVKVFQDLKAAGKAFGMPTTILIDKNGCDLGTLNGPAEWASDDAIQLIKTALQR